ncbi:MAG: DsbA family protein [Myxococcota bacterium]
MSTAMYTAMYTAVCAAVCAAVLLAACTSCNKEGPAQGEPEVRIRLDGERFVVPLFDDDPALGGETPLVTIVIFTDYACPPCGQSWQVMKNLVSEYGDDLRVVYRSYTVAGFAQGERAAEAAYAAAAQGKFWEMHWRLFGHAGQFDRPTLTAHAEALGLDVARFTEDLDTGAFAGKRIRHRREAKALGIRGLPVMFVNGLYLAGYQKESMWHGVIDEELAHVRQMITDGVPRAKVYETLLAEAKPRQVGKPDAPELAKELADKQAANFYPTELTPPEPDQRYQIRPDDAPAVGPDDAPVVIVEFLDFQCPYCRKAHAQEVKGLLDKHGDNVRLAVRQLPLEIHIEARGAALAALAAHRQGKFFPFHDRLLEHSGELGRNTFVEWAEALGLDKDRFLADLDDPALSAVVAEDVRLAAKVGVNGTPAYFVNGRYLSGFRKGVLTTLVEEELAEADKRIAAGTARGEVFEAIMADAIPKAAFPN